MHLLTSEEIVDKILDAYPDVKAAIFLYADGGKRQVLVLLIHMKCKIDEKLQVGEIVGMSYRHALTGEKKDKATVDFYEEREFNDLEENPVDSLSRTIKGLTDQNFFIDGGTLEPVFAQEDVKTLYVKMKTALNLEISKREVKDLFGGSKEVFAWGKKL